MPFIFLNGWRLRLTFAKAQQQSAGGGAVSPQTQPNCISILYYCALEKWITPFCQGKDKNIVFLVIPKS
jgi:hypothetical protein